MIERKQVILIAPNLESSTGSSIGLEFPIRQLSCSFEQQVSNYIHFICCLMIGLEPWHACFLTSDIFMSKNVSILVRHLGLYAINNHGNQKVLLSAILH